MRQYCVVLCVSLMLITLVVPATASVPPGATSHAIAFTSLFGPRLLQASPCVVEVCDGEGKALGATALLPSPRDDDARVNATVSARPDAAAVFRAPTVSLIGRRDE